MHAVATYSALTLVMGDAELAAAGGRGGDASGVQRMQDRAGVSICGSEGICGQVGE